MFKSFGVLVFALSLAACGVSRPRPAEQPSAAAPGQVLGVPRAGQNYIIEPQQSELRILVYRAGPLARLGHNHVLVNRSVHGSVKAGAAGGSVFSLQISVAAFVVDAADARREEGADFEGELPEDAKAGTLQHMLSPALLDADKYPVMSISGSVPSVAAPGSAMTASAAISVAGHESTLELPLTLDSDSGRVTASGTLQLRQTALGLVPYSLLLGALQVEDAMTLKFRIVATPASAP